MHLHVCVRVRGNERQIALLICLEDWHWMEHNSLWEDKHRRVQRHKTSSSYCFTCTWVFSAIDSNVTVNSPLPRWLLNELHQHFSLNVSAFITAYNNLWYNISILFMTNVLILPRSLEMTLRPTKRMGKPLRLSQRPTLITGRTRPLQFWSKFEHLLPSLDRRQGSSSLLFPPLPSTCHLAVDVSDVQTGDSHKCSV